MKTRRKIIEECAVAAIACFQHYHDHRVSSEICMHIADILDKTFPLAKTFEEIKREKQVKVPVTIYGKTPSCIAICPNSGECANHCTAGDFRHEDGLVPNLEQREDGAWYCSKEPCVTYQGAVLIDGTHSNDENYR